MGKFVWIASYPKSGNTWIRLFLHAVRKLKAGPVDRIEFDDPDWRAHSFQDNARRLYEPYLPVGWEKATKRDMALARPRAHRDAAASAEGLLPAKTHNALISVDGVPTITADCTAHAIYIVRHPFDVAVSVKDHFGAPDYARAVAQMNFDNYVQAKDERFVDAPIGSWRQNVASWTRPGLKAVTVLRYEDLLSDPETSFAKVMNVFQIAPDRSLLRDAVALTSFDRLKTEEERSGFSEASNHTDSFFKRGSAGHGETTLSRALRKQLIRHNEPIMKRFGYLD